MEQEFIKKSKKITYCINCGKEGHLSKLCNEAVTSYGIILIDLDIKSTLKTNIINKLVNSDNKIDIINDSNDIGIRINDSNDIELFAQFKNYVKLLLIQRKHTLGFLEFIRGRYNIENVDGIIFLFQQMTPQEINKIKNLSFDNLWSDVWGDDKNRSIYHNEYSISKEKFHKLKNDENGYLQLQFYIDNVVPTWNYAEWGFPKGRRNIKELDKDCAIREFKEETNFNDDDIVILNSLNPLSESFVGTNGINYRHIYYFAMTKNNKVPCIDLSNTTQQNEIGDINYFTYEEMIKVIRPYHTERLDIITKVYIHLINTLIEMSKQI